VQRANTGVLQSRHKHREDLLDGALCAWTAAFWERHGDERVQILGGDPSLPTDTAATPLARRRGTGGVAPPTDTAATPLARRHGTGGVAPPTDPLDEAGRRPVVVAPARPSQRRPRG
jgi:hypothetical protein